MYAGTQYTYNMLVGKNLEQNGALTYFSITANIHMANVSLVKKLNTYLNL